MWLRRGETLDGGLQDRIIRAGCAEMEDDPANATDDARAYLQQLEADRSALRVRQFGVLQRASTDVFQQDIGNRGQQYAELIGCKAMTTGAIGKQLKLLFLDAIFHLASRAIYFVV